MRKAESAKKTARQVRRAVSVGFGWGSKEKRRREVGGLTYGLEGVFRPKFFFLEPVKLHFLARGETPATVERLDTGREISVFLREMRPLSL